MANCRHLLAELGISRDLGIGNFRWRNVWTRKHCCLRFQTILIVGHRSNRLDDYSFSPAIQREERFKTKSTEGVAAIVMHFSLEG